MDDSTEATVARIDERTQNLEKSLTEIKDGFKWLKGELSSHYVTKSEFEPVKNEHVTKEAFEPVRKLVYGVVGVILTAVIVAIVALVVKKG
jgi:hypothetical protein